MPNTKTLPISIDELNRPDNPLRHAYPELEVVPARDDAHYAYWTKLSRKEKLSISLWTGGLLFSCLILVNRRTWACDDITTFERSPLVAWIGSNPISDFVWIILQVLLLLSLYKIVMLLYIRVNKRPQELRIFVFKDAENPKAKEMWGLEKEKFPDEGLSEFKIRSGSRWPFLRLSRYLILALPILYIWLNRSSSDIRDLSLAVAAVLLGAQHLDSLQNAEAHIGGIKNVERELKGESKNLSRIKDSLLSVRDLQKLSQWRKQVYDEISKIEDHAFVVERAWEIDKIYWDQSLDRHAKIYSFEDSPGIWNAIRKLVGDEELTRKDLSKTRPRMRVLFEPTREHLALFPDLLEKAQVQSEREVQERFLARNLLGLIHQSILFYQANLLNREKIDAALAQHRRTASTLNLFGRGEVAREFWNYKHLKKILRDRDIARVLISCPKRWSYRVGPVTYDLFQADTPDEAFVRNLNQASTADVDSEWENTARSNLIKWELSRYAHYSSGSRSYILTCLLGPTLLTDPTLIEMDTEALGKALYLQHKDQWLTAVSYNPFKAQYSSSQEWAFQAFVQKTLIKYLESIVRTLPGGTKYYQNKEEAGSPSASADAETEIKGDSGAAATETLIPNGSSKPDTGQENYLVRELKRMMV